MRSRNTCARARRKGARANPSGAARRQETGGWGNMIDRDLFLPEDLKRVLERRDLLLAPGRAFGEVYAGVQAGGLQLVEVLEGGAELLLRALEVAHGLREVRLRADLLLALRLELVGLGVLVRIGGRGELLEGGRGRGLLGARLLVEADEVREDHLEHADDALPLAHTRVGLREGLRGLVLRVARLRERGGRCRLGVEALEHAERRFH